ncbi:DNA translocase FtsK [Psychrobacillus sp. NPDC096426]|uniref:DNA translocase FtsK n=1 Tax=Psychrobacillus sp. NPDC096426 TaxID=3364491 RepID=UPI0037FAA0C3
MNWFKKLFGLNEEEYKEEIEVEEKTVSTTRSKTPFRFPLISDEEKMETIYEQPNEDKIIHEPFIEKQLTEEQLYKPLYKQDKWQQRKQPTIIHRSEKITVDDTDTPAIVRKKRAFSPTEVPSPVFGFSKRRESSIPKEKPLADNAPIRTIQETWQQRKIQKVDQQQDKNTMDEIITTPSKKRAFTPTEVPSPIYGFSKNRETQLPLEESVEKEVKIHEIIEESPITSIPEQTVKEEVPPTMKATEESVPTPELVQVESVEKEEKIEEFIEESPITSIPEQMVKEEIPPTMKESEESVPTSELVQVESVEKEEKIEEIIEESPITSISEQTVKEEVPPTMKATEESVPTPELVQEESVEKEEKIEEIIEESPITSIPEQMEIEEVPPTMKETEESVPTSELVQEEKLEVRKENVRPFNVLMLKSDKQNIEKTMLKKEEEIVEPIKLEAPITITPTEATAATLVEEPLPVLKQAEEEKLEVRKENIRPFNVLMLKSDKQNIEKTMLEEEIGEPIKVEAPIAITPTEAIAATLVEEQTPVLEQVEEEKLEGRKENIRPFNVLMLKSDKQNLNKLNTNNIHEPVIQKIVEKTELPEATLNEEKELTEQEIVQSTYTRPSFSYLLPPEMKDEDREWMEEQADTLVEALSYFQVTGEIVQMVQGPAVTQFELTVGHGTKVSKIRNLADDLKLALAAKDIRIQAPIPGKRSIGIEIPNRTSRAVRLSEVLNTEVFVQSESPLEAALGLDLTGKPVTLDLRKMPHGLIAGATGSGKSVFINSLLVSLLYKATPEEVKLLLIDPKMVELAPFNHIPHLVSPVITDVKAATAALKWAVEEMERRYQLFAHIGVRDISRYNTLATEKRQFAQKLPYIVIVIDELADLMMMAPAEVEDAICRIAQKARACGIHLVLATQRPSVDVITGLIKANIPTRIAFSVSSQIDSRTILDQQGAERLLGRGDMLYQGNGMSSPDRIQGTYVSDDEIEAVIDYARSQGTPEYIFEQEELLHRAETSEQDDLFEEACRFIVEQGSASTSLLQRKFHLGYNRAARLIDAMYESGYISEQKGSKARDVLLTNDSLEQIFS